MQIKDLSFWLMQFPMDDSKVVGKIVVTTGGKNHIWVGEGLGVNFKDETELTEPKPSEVLIQVGFSKPPPA